MYANLSYQKVMDVAALIFGGLVILAVNYFPRFAGQEEALTQSFVIILGVFLGLLRVDNALAILANRTLVQNVIDTFEDVSKFDIPDTTENMVVETAVSIGNTFKDKK